MHIPEWLDKLMGQRERDIVSASDAHVSNYDSDNPIPGSRLPLGQKHIISSEGRFTIDFKARKIIF